MGYMTKPKLVIIRDTYGEFNLYFFPEEFRSLTAASSRFILDRFLDQDQQIGL